MTAGRPAMLLFDGDCGFCSTSARWLTTHVRPGDQVLPFQWLDLGELGIDPARADREVLWVPSWGPVRGGQRAIAAALRSSGRRHWRMVGVLLDLPLVRAAAGVVYRLVARYRHRLPGGTPACARPQRRG